MKKSQPNNTFIPFFKVFQLLFPDFLEDELDLKKLKQMKEIDHNKIKQIN